MPIPNSSWNPTQRADEAACQKAREEAEKKIQQEIDQYGTTSSYSGRTVRNHLTQKYYLKFAR